MRPSYNDTIKLSASSDSDGDRIVDSRVMCAGAPEGWSVKHNGYPVYQQIKSTTTDANGTLTAITKFALNHDLLFTSASASAKITSQGESILTRSADALRQRRREA